MLAALNDYVFTSRADVRKRFGILDPITSTFHPLHQFSSTDSLKSLSVLENKPLLMFLELVGFNCSGSYSQSM